MDPLLEFFFVAAALLMVGVCLLRVRQLERECAELRGKAGKRSPQDPEREALAAVGTLASEICHMIVSPLTVILAQCELARRGGDAARRFGTIEEQARRIATVVERYRGVAQRSREEVQEIDAVECAHAAIRSVSALAEARGVAIHEHFEGPVALHANRFLLSQALRHILRAAVEGARADLGDVTVAVGLLPPAGEPTHVAFAVADDGPGIPPTLLPRIFHPSQEATTGRLELGYSVAYAIARAMGANLVIDTAPGEGTRVTIKVPVERPAPLPADADPAPAVASR